MLRKENLKDLYPLSPMQEGMLFHALHEPDSTAYFQQLSFRLAEELDRNAFDAAWGEVVRRHDILRSVFVHENVARPLQAVLKDAPPAIRAIDLRHLSAPEQERHLDAWKLADRFAGFALDTAPPLRIALFRLGAASTEIVWSHHHILMDGWCLGIVQHEFLELYRSIVAGRPASLPHATPYSRYIKWLEARDGAAAKRYWAEYLAGTETLTSLARPGTAVADDHPSEIETALGATVAAQLRARAAAAQVTPSTVIHAAWGILLGKYNDVQDVVFGSVIANRPEEIAGIETMVGLFINAVPVRISWQDTTSFRELLLGVQRDMLARHAHEFLPLPEIQSASPLKRALFDHLMLVQNYPLERQLTQEPGFRIERAELFEHTHYPLTVSFVGGDDPVLCFAYDGARFPGDRMQRIAAHFATLLERLLAAWEAPIESLGLASAAEEDAAQTLCSAAPPETTLVGLFEAAVRRHPDKIALTCDGRQLTYAELDRLANGLAHSLRQRVAIRPDDRVALLAARSERLVVGLLGIAKSGAAYVAIDPGFPADRIAFQLADSNSRAIVGDVASDAFGDLPVVDLGSVVPADDPPSPGPAPRDLLYVAYTSGSTGRPKGVMIEHRNVAAFAATLAPVFGLTDGDTILGLTTVTFDISVLELLCSLAVGMRVVLASDETAADPALVLAVIEAEGVNVLQATPSRLTTLIESGGWAALAGLRVVLIGGETMPAPIWEGLQRLSGVAAFNVYGPTETTIWSTAQRIGGGAPSVGQPLPDESVVILSRSGRLCPPGVAGEVFIAGSGLGRGYLGQETLTAERYAAHPFVPGERLYRTGDVGLRRGDGAIEIIGRRDAQVKLRGYRIELGEIEAALLRCDGVSQAVVRLHERVGRELIAYAVAETGIDGPSLRGALARLLPGYMVPSEIVVLDRMPLLPSGKVDRAALPEPGADASPLGNTAPRDAIEERLVAIWQAVLGRATVGIDDDFFAIGGHSLKATQLLGRIHKELRSQISMKDLFAAPTVAGLAAVIRGATATVLQEIVPLAESESYALSHAQRRMWILERMAPGGTSYVMPVALLLDGRLNVAALRDALDALVARHATLRTIFPLVGDEPRQVVLPPRPLALETIDLTGQPDAEEHAHAIAREILSRPFAIETEAPVRAALIAIAADRHALVFATHHIVSDGVSLSVLQRDLSRLYAGFAAGKPASLRPLKLQYRDFAAWQNQLPDGGDRAYWLEKLGGSLPVLDLPLDFPRPNLASSAGETVTRRLGLARSSGLRRLARESQASVFMVLVALVKILLHRTAGAEDIVVGIPIAGRLHPDLKDQVGVFVNTLVLRDRIDGDASLRATLEAVKATALDAFEHQAYPFDRLVDELAVARDPGRSPLFDVMVSLQEAEESTLRLGDAGIAAMELAATASRFDLTFAFAELEDGEIGLALEYRTSLFRRSRIERFAVQVELLADTLLADPAQAVGIVPLVTAADAAALPRFNATAAPYPDDKTIVDLFAEQVVRTPERSAVVDGDRMLSYAALWAETGRVANRLAAEGIGPDDRVALLAERSVDAVVGIFGILRAGAAYVPLDPGHPDQRLAELIADAGCRTVVTTRRDAARAAALSSAPVIVIADIDGPADAPRLAALTPRHLAYVIFTSGTTGRPKGVMIEHRSVVNLASWFARDFCDPLGEGLRHAGLAALVFDVSVHEIFGSLLRGDTLYLVPDAVKQDPPLLDAFLRRNRIDVMSTTPSLLAAALDAGLWAAGCSLRRLTIGAEPVPRSLVERFFATAGTRDVSFCNLYGPTECCVESTSFTIARDDSERGAVPIGRPGPNMRVHVCDSRLQLVAPGIVGELCIAGPCLARGYLGREALTAASFVAAPFDPDGIVYRTGDLGFWREDGTLQLIGRRDDQVKIRGYRIEPGEIEHRLADVAGVETAVVVARDAVDGTRELVAYLVMPGLVMRETLDADALRSSLARTLPPYMIPAHFVALDVLPVNRSGKVDRAALPSPTGRHPVAAAPPRDALEATILGIFQQVLANDAIGTEDDFFTSGGHSLSAVRASARIGEALGITVPLAEFFAAPTVAQLAALLRHRQPGQASVVRPAPALADYPLSHAQRRLWVLGRMEGGDAAYAIAAALALAGPLDAAALRAAFDDLVERHEILRTVFPESDGGPRQRVQPPTLGMLTIAEAADAAGAAAAARDLAALPFDLLHGPLLRARLWRIDDARHVLLIALHHIIGDAWSLNVIQRDLAAFYAARRDGRAPGIAALTLQAKDFAWHETQTGTDARLAADRLYWQTKLGGELPMLDLPSDFPRPAIKTYHGGTLAYRIDDTVARGLEQRGRAAGVGLYTMLVTLVKLLLRRHSGQEDIVVGGVVTERGSAALEDQIGFYVQTVALRDSIRGDESLSSVIPRVGATVAEAMTHLSYPFDTLVEELAPPRDASRSPLFDVMVIFETGEPGVFPIAGLQATPLDLAPPVAKFDITFHFTRSADGLQAAIEYNTDLFAADRIERIAAQVQSLAAVMATQEGATPVGRLDLLPASEQVLGDFASGGAMPVPEDSIAARFARQARETPDAAAIIDRDATLSYAELDGAATAMARFLAEECKLHPGEPVAVLLDRSARAIAALLGILKAGGIYLPLDPQVPAARLNILLERADCRLLIGEAAALPDGLAAMRSIGSPWRGQPTEVLLAAAPPAPLAAEDAAYLIFTSGSTGEPKGVLLANRGFVNMALRQIETFGVLPRDRVLQFASPAFDASMSEIFMALFCGAALVLVGRETIGDRDAFAAHLGRHRVTVATLPPVFLNTLGRPSLPDLRVLITAGEPPVLEDVRHWAARLRYFNAYGPTESSVCATIFEVGPVEDGRVETAIPIGRPLANTAIYVLDAELAPLPIGVAGEICIAGIGLAQRYVGDPAETARRFVDFPSRPGTRLYRTGDRGWWRGDGNLVYSGRLDEQVKIRGQRVEPAEIVRALEATAGVKQAIVVARGDGPDRRLVAYLIGDAERSGEAELRASIAARLPPAMVPSRFVWLDAFPRTVNGKIDRQALPAPAAVQATVAAPRDEIETTLAAAWATVLQRHDIGIHDNFFELGGDSIRLLQVASELQKRGLRLEIGDIYRHPTIAALAGRLGLSSPGLSSSSIAQDSPSGTAPLSASQAWFFATFTGNRNHFNQSVLLRARDRLDAAAVETALRAILTHHDALRLRFRAVDGIVLQEFGPLPERALVRTIDLRNTADEAAEMARHADILQRGLDIAAGILVAAALFRGELEDRLFLVIHHLVVDGVTWRILLADLATALQAGGVAALPDKTHSFKVWAEQQHHCGDTAALRDEATIWRAILAGAPSEAAPSEAKTGRIGDRAMVSLALSEAETSALIAAAPRRFGTRPEAILMTALAGAARRWDGRDALVLTLEGHGREAIVEGIDVGRTAGWFTSLYPVRLATPAEATSGEAVRDTQRRLDAVPRRGVGYGILAYLRGDETLRLAGGMSFNYLGVLDAADDGGPFLPGIASLGDPVDPDAASPHALDFLASVQGGIFQIALGYDPRHHPRAPALLDEFAAALRTLLNHPVDEVPATPLIPPPMLPYRGRVLGGGAVRLAAERPRKIFAMPPLFGYGAAFRNLAEALGTATLYAFDFIEDEDRLAQYVRGIAAEQPRGPLVLLGYSGGGNLAFEVAKALEAAGHTVSDLILLDAPLKRRAIEQSEAEIAAMTESNLDYFRTRLESDADYRVFMTDPQMQALMLRKMKSFIRYLNGLINDGAIAGDIHLIRSSQEWAEAADWDLWATRTSGSLFRLQGTGIHAGMTDDTHVAANGALVDGILANRELPL